LWFAPSLAALAALMAWGIVLSVQRPLLALTRAAERIAAGDLSAPIRGGDDEIGRLGTALEHMRRQLKHSIHATARANADLERRVEERTTELQRLLGKLISAQEDERRRVARELHDETSQVLTGLGLALHAAGASNEPGAVRALQPLVDRLHDGLHSLIANLRPPALDDLGLAVAIEGLADTQLRRAGIAVRSELAELEDSRVDPDVEIALFRIVQEAILNIVRHSGATTVLLQGGMTERGLWIDIEDDGVGFDPAAVRRDDKTLCGIGLLGMRERADLLGGRLTIESAPAQGTRVRIEVPGRTREARAS
jgi:signal transduction histidine kinase